MSLRASKCGIVVQRFMFREPQHDIPADLGGANRLCLCEELSNPKQLSFKYR